MRRLSKYTPLNNEEIQNKVGCKFILYENMYKIKDIKQLLPQTLILYQLARVGHFCCIFQNDEGIQCFDSRGYFPDDELIKANPDIPNHDKAYLDRLLYNINVPVIYSDYLLQAKETSTCGMWCAVRMRYSNLYCDEFAECFANIPDRDETIVKLYSNL